MAQYDLIVVGGGAAGFFCAINAASLDPQLKILILEKSNRLLAKVRVSGGGRCNVTHREMDSGALSKHYPRGGRFLKGIFKQFGPRETLQWFHSRDIELKIEEDGRMFPTSDRSATIINCFLNEAAKYQIEIRRSHEVQSLQWAGNHYHVVTSNGSFNAKKVLISVGGYPQPGRYQWLKDLGLSVFDPIPSLFTFNDQSRKYADLMGLSVSDTSVKIEGTNYESRGPVLITHWGLSGPSIIKLSAWAAQHLHDVHYEFTVLVNWMDNANEDTVRQRLLDLRVGRAKSLLSNVPIEGIPVRLWHRLCNEAGIERGKIWGELSLKLLNRLVEQLVRCRFEIKGKTTYKEEFVTCGGIDLAEINPSTMESKKCPGLYFAGEVLNVDGETGGFNFQAAWSTAYVAAASIAGT